MRMAVDQLGFAPIFTAAMMTVILTCEVWWGWLYVWWAACVVARDGGLMGCMCGGQECCWLHVGPQGC